MNWRLFAACQPGLEPWLALELKQLFPNAFRESEDDLEVLAGGVAFSGDGPMVARALLGLGVASRLLIRIADFPARHLNDLKQVVSRLDWRQWLLPDVPRQVRVSSHKSRLYHTGAIAQRICQGIQAALGDDPPPTNPAPVQLAVRLQRDHCQLSLDASGQPLHRRGYRKNPYRAPLREDLARALILASGWNGEQPLIDPMCGSGTLLIEASMMAAGWPPGRGRNFGIEQTVVGRDNLIDRNSSRHSPSAARPPTTPPSPDVDHISSRHSPSAARPPTTPPSLGIDRDPAAIQAAREYAAACPWLKSIPIEWQVGDLRDVPMPDSAVSIICNPPWGDRLSPTPHVGQLYAWLGDLRRRAATGSSLALVTGHRQLAYKTGIPLHSAFLSDAGGIKINAFVEGAIPGQSISSGPE